MRGLALALAAVLSSPLVAIADSTNEILTKTDGYVEQGWTVSNPTGSSDFFNTRYDGSGTTGGIGLSVADFGAGSSFPRVGLYEANLGIDPSGDTPDLTTIVAEGNSPAVLGAPVFTDFLIDLGPAPWSGPVHVAIQFPPADPGLLAIGADSDNIPDGGSELPGSPNPADSSGFTSDAYATPAQAFASGDWFLNNQNVLDGTSSVLRVNTGGLSGDHQTIMTYAGDQLGTFVSASDHPGGNEVFLLFLSFLGNPIRPAGPVLPLPQSTGVTSSIRVQSTYPSGAGNITFNLIAITGTPGVRGSVALSNEVKLKIPPCERRQRCTYPGFGCYDDGTYETGWVVAIPAGSSDYFNVNHGDAAAAGITGINGHRMAVMDFGTSTTAYPRSGQTRENTSVDPTGNTPDLSSPYVNQAFPFPALTFCSTSGQMVGHSFSTFASLTPNLHGFIQLPPGDSGLLGIGGDTNSTFISGLSGWTLDGYSTPSNLFGVNWGMCADGF